MECLLNFLSGPGLYFSATLFVLGLLTRFVLYFWGLDWRLERVAYKPYLGHGLKGGFHSALKWLVPFATHGWRAQPLATLGYTLLHIGVVLVPLFLLGHNVIMEQRFGFSLPALPQNMADILALLGLAGALIMFGRRLVLPQVRVLTSGQDYLLLLLAFVTLLTGILAVKGLGDYKTMLLAHLLCGELVLVLAPFTRLAHIVLFFASRIQIGMDFAIKRGGRNRESGAFFPW